MKWISVKDRMPEEEESIIFTYGENETEVGLVVNGTFLGLIDEGRLAPVYNVSHWMPLPESPKDK